jgi:CheY-like chemotaxis protein
MMPGDDGWEVCRKIKADDKTKHIPVIIFTVRTGADSRKKSIECGAEDHIDKPFEGTVLLDTIKRVLEERVET